MKPAWLQDRVHLIACVVAFCALLGIPIAQRAAVMCSYKAVNGDYACENRYLLTDVLRKDWKFKGFVVSDCGATHSTPKAPAAGLDQEQPLDGFTALDTSKPWSPGVFLLPSWMNMSAGSCGPNLPAELLIIRSRRASSMCRRVLRLLELSPSGALFQSWFGSA